MEHHLTRIGLGRSRKLEMSREVTPGEFLYHHWSICPVPCWRDWTRLVVILLGGSFVVLKCYFTAALNRSQPSQFTGNGCKRPGNVHGDPTWKENGVQPSHLRRYAAVEFFTGSLPAGDHSWCQPHRSRVGSGTYTLSSINIIMHVTNVR